MEWWNIGTMADDQNNFQHSVNLLFHHSSIQIFQTSISERISMKHKVMNRITLAAFLFLLMFAQAYAQTDPLPSWNDGPAKKAIVEFVKTTTEKGSPKFVPPEARIVSFDQDGTTWVGYLMYRRTN